MQSWDLREIETPGGSRSPVVLRSDPAARAVLVALEPGQQLGDHQVKERALVSVVEGAVRVESGGEFTVLMPGGTLEVALQRAQQLREAVKQLSVSQRGQTYGRVTVSIGVAAYPDSGHSEEAVLRSAEAALHQAKREGRDRVVVSP